MSDFAGTRMLFRLFLRRDRIRIPVWLVALTVLIVGSIASFPGLYETQEAIDVRNELLMRNPVGILLTGPGYGLDTVTPDNLGPMAVNEMSASSIIAFALMGIFFVVRHTRAEEQEGRLELLRAGLVGRYAGVTAAFLLTSLVSIVAGVVIGLGLVAQGYEAGGSFAFGLSMAAVAITFAGITAFLVQLTEHSRAGTGMALAIFGVLFFVRAIGDIRDSDIRFLSPIAWAQAVRPFAGEQWWILLLLAGLAILFVYFALLLVARRDIGTGLFRPRPGRKSAAASLVRPLGLAFRLQRATLIAWAVAMFIFGAMIGSVTTEAEQMIAEVDIYEQYFTVPEGVTLLEAFLATYLGFIAITVVGYALQAITLLRSEESKGHAESLLAGSISRIRWAGSHLTATFIGSIIVLGAAGVGAAGTFALGTGAGEQFLSVLGATLLYLPAVWIFVGIAMALFGLVHRAFPLAWGAFAWVAIVAMLGPLLGLPDWTMDVTPFAYIPQLPAEEFAATALLTQTGIVAALVVIGLLGFRRRDVDLT